MKFIAALLLLSIPAAAMAQVASHTNRLVTFTNLQGRAYDQVDLVNTDAFSVIYRTDSGGGRVYFTNLAPAVLGEMGLATNSAATAVKLNEDIARQKELSKAEEKERALNPANWKHVHVREITRPYGDGVECSVQEIPRRVILRNPPPGLIAYWTQRQNLVQSIAQINTQVQQLTTQIQQLANQTSRFTTQIQQREYDQQMAEATLVRDAKGEPIVVDYQVGRIAMIQQARVKLEADKVELQESQTRLSEWQSQLPGVQQQWSDANAQLKILDAEGSKTTAIKVFPSSSTYLGIPVLVFKEYSIPPEASATEPARPPSSP